MALLPLRSFVGQLVGWCVTRAGWVVLAGLIGTVLAALYLVTNLAVDTNLDDLIDPDTPFRERQRALDTAFPQLGDRIVAVVSAPSFDSRLAATRAFAAAMEARDSVVAEVFAPATLPFLTENALLFHEVVDVERTLDRLAGAQPLLARLAADARPETLIGLLAEGLERGEDGPVFEAALDTIRPIVVDAANGAPRPIPWLDLMGAAGGREVLVVEVAPELDYTRLRPAAMTLEAARSAAAEVEGRFAEARVALTGEIPLEAEELEAASVGAAGAGIVSLGLVLLVLVIGIRCLGTIAAIVLTLLAGLIVTASLAIAVVGAFTMISIAFAVLFIGLGADFLIHVVLRAQEATTEPLPWPDAIRRAGEATAPALALCATTTAAAFLAFAPTGYVGLAQLGIIAAMGMGVAFVSALTLLPALLRVIGRPRPMPPMPLPRIMQPRPRWARWSLVVVAAMLVPLALGVRFTGDPLALKDPDAPSVEAFRTLLFTPTASPYRAEVLAANLAATDALRARLAAVPEVGRVVGPESFVPADQHLKLALIDDARLFLEIPPLTPPAASDADAFAAALERLARHAPDPGLQAAASTLADAVRTMPHYADEVRSSWFRYWPQALDRLRGLLQARPVTLDDVPAVLRDRYVAADGSIRLDVLPAFPLDDRAARDRFADAVLEAVPSATGNVVQIRGATRLVAGAMLEATLLASALVVLLVAAVLRNRHETLAVLGAVGLAAALTVGVMPLAGLSFNFANVIVLPLLLGFGVDATIHVVLRLRSGVTHLRTTSTPRAVVLSALTTLASFGTLALSPHQGTASMGLLLTIALLANLAAVLIALPAWLRPSAAR